MTPPPPSSTLFPYTTLFRSVQGRVRQRRVGELVDLRDVATGSRGQRLAGPGPRSPRGPPAAPESRSRDHPGDDLLRSEEHTSELQSRPHLVCRLLLEKKKKH